MAISFVAASDKAEADNATTCTLDATTITGLAENDLLLFCLVTDDNVTITSSDGLDQVSQHGTATGADRQLAIFRKFAAASETTYDFTTAAVEDTTGVILAYRGVDQTTPIDATATESNTTNDASPDPPAITTVTDNAFVISVIGGTQGSGDTPSVPSGYTERFLDTEATVVGELGAADIDAGTAGVEDPGDWTNWSTTFDSVMTTVAIRPAAGGGSGQPTLVRHRHIPGMKYW